MKKNNKGFTLAELLIVVAIIAVLVAIAIPVFTTQLEKSREATDLANVRSAYAALVTGWLDTGTATSVTVQAQQKVANWQNDAGYLGKGPDDKYFKGAFDYCEFYFQKAAEPDITYTGSEGPDSSLRGDIDLNGKFNSADVLLFQKWLLGTETKLPDPKAGDLKEDGRLNIADLCTMKQELLA